MCQDSRLKTRLLDFTFTNNLTKNEDLGCSVGGEQAGGGRGCGRSSVGRQGRGRGGVGDILILNVEPTFF